MSESASRMWSSLPPPKMPKYASRRSAVTTITLPVCTSTSRVSVWALVAPAPKPTM